MGKTALRHALAALGAIGPHTAADDVYACFGACFDDPLGHEAEQNRVMLNIAMR